MDILSKTKAFVFVYSKVRDELPPFLNKEVFDKYADHFQLFLKGDKSNSIFSAEEFILQLILFRLSKSVQIKIQGIAVNFRKNGYLKNPTDILYLEKILGRKSLLEKLNKKSSTISNQSIESLLKDVDIKILKDENKNLLVTADAQTLIKKIQHTKELTSLDVLKQYGLQILKEVLEIGIAKI